MKIGSLFRKKIEKQVEKEDKRELGDKPLAYVSRVLRGLIPTVGIAVIRKRVIDSIEKDFRDAVKKNPDAVEALIQNAVKTPDYMGLLKDLGMDEEHLRVMAREVIKTPEKTPHFSAGECQQ